MTLKIRINRKGVESMTRQITDQLGSLISTGAMAVGSLLPSERSLANSLGVARNVVRGSYEYLEKAGVVKREDLPVNSRPLRQQANKRTPARDEQCQRDKAPEKSVNLFKEAHRDVSAQGSDNQGRH